MVDRSPVHIACVLAVMVALLFLPTVASAVDRLVNPADTCAPSALPQHDTIQGAVDAAAAGEEIGVCPGLYSESVAIGTPGLSLVAIGHVVLTGGIPCLNVIAPGVRIRGFEMEACEGAVRLVADSGRIENNIIHHGDVGIIVLGLDNLVVNNLVRDNTDTGISVSGPCTGTVIRNNTVRGNTNFGIRVTGDDCTITKNLVQHNGVGIGAEGGIGGVISFNSASFNAVGIMLTDVTDHLVTRNNVSRSAPGPDCIWDGLNPNTFVANSCRTEIPPGAWD